MAQIENNAVVRGVKIFFRRPEMYDLQEFTQLNRESAAFHTGLVNPPKDRDSFIEFIAKNERPENVSFFVCSKGSGEIAGAVNLSQIFRGGFQNAYLGYYLGEKFAGQGFGTEMISLIVRYAFETINLHRIEANIQPQNLASIAVAAKNGFRKEGFSPAYLRIGGEWRDHERWAIINTNWSETL